MKEQEKKFPRRFWTQAEEAAVLADYATTPTRVLAERLGRSQLAVHQRAYHLGLRKDPEYMREEHGGRAKTVGARHRFQPGIEPWNKGVSYIPGGRSPETRFRPGQIPATWKPIGSYRVRTDGVLERKVSDTHYTPRDWVPVHRLVWVDHHGPIPAGHAVVFRPGRRTSVLDEITIDRLECLSRRELMLRNSTWRHGIEIGRVTQLRGAITRQINRRTKQEQAA